MTAASKTIATATCLAFLAFASTTLALAADTAKTSKPSKPAKPGPEVVVVGDASQDVSAPQPPTADAPTYYFFIGQKEKPLGKSWAGEKYPSKAVIEAEVTKALASQHYIRVKPGDPKPSLVVMVTWGTAGSLEVDMPGDNSGGSDDGSDDSAGSGGGDSGGTLNFSAREMAMLTGANKQAVRNGTDVFATEQAEQAMRDDRVYIMLGAFDADSLAQKPSVKKLLWRTVMSIDTLKDSFPASLATMLQSAAPYFGRNTDTGIVVDDKVRREGHVELGEMTVVDDNASGSKKPARAKPAATGTSSPGAGANGAKK